MDANPIATSEAENRDVVSGTSGQELSGEEEAQLLQRLRGMGYIE
jgi:hypothetical protein